MKVTFNGRSVTLRREHGERSLRNDSDLWYRLRNELRRRGRDVIKKPMWKDGHLTDSTRHYVRTRRMNGKASFWIHDGTYAIRDAYRDFNANGRVDLDMDRHLDKEER